MNASGIADAIVLAAKREAKEARRQDADGRVVMILDEIEGPARYVISIRTERKPEKRKEEAIAKEELACVECGGAADQRVRHPIREIVDGDDTPVLLCDPCLERLSDQSDRIGG